MVIIFSLDFIILFLIYFPIHLLHYRFSSVQLLLLLSGDITIFFPGIPISFNIFVNFNFNSNFLFYFISKLTVYIIVLSLYLLCYFIILYSIYCILLYLIVLFYITLHTHILRYFVRRANL